jgi:hypothetical protein
MTGTWQGFQGALTSIISTYNLDSTSSSHPCLKGLSLSWELDTANTRRRRSDPSKRDTCSMRYFYLFSEVNTTDMDGSLNTYLAGFDLGAGQTDFGNYLCDSGYQVLQNASPWEPAQLPGVPSYWPFDLDWGTFTGYMYNGYDSTVNGTLTCDGGDSWACTMDQSTVAVVNCDGTELYPELYCTYTF